MVYKNLGDTCKEFRKSIGLTQSTVADLTGYTISNISMFEQGHVNNMRLLLFYIQEGLPAEAAINSIEQDVLDHIQGGE